MTITVNEVNEPPVLDPIPDRNIDELVLHSFTLSADDPVDIPKNNLSYSSPDLPAGASLDPLTGVFDWTPSEVQGPGEYLVTFVVTDDGSPYLTDTQTVTITVDEVNLPPELGTIGDRTIDELVEHTFFVTATDLDIPINSIDLSVEGLPEGATFDEMTGEFSWTPSESQGPGTYPITFTASDDGTPILTDSETIIITVTEINLAPTLAPIGHQPIDEESTLSFVVQVTDPDDPANVLTLDVDTVPSGALPAGATFDVVTGEFNWTPTETQGPDEVVLVFSVSDNGSPVLSDSETVTITVNEFNDPPVLAAIGNQSVPELTTRSFTLSATDTDLPANTLSYSADDLPVGASLNSTTGFFSWTPTEAQGPNTYTVTFRVSDNGSPILSDEEVVTFTVGETNNAPEFTAIPNKSINEESLLAFTVVATDPQDVPSNNITYGLTMSLVGSEQSSGLPQGVSFDEVTGQFSWTPSEIQGPSVWEAVFSATDDGSPELSDFETITITVNEVNVAPTLKSVGNHSVDENVQLSFTASATDDDIPLNRLTFSAIDLPDGASFD